MKILNKNHSSLKLRKLRTKAKNKENLLVRRVEMLDHRL